MAQLKPKSGAAGSKLWIITGSGLCKKRSAFKKGMRAQRASICLVQYEAFARRPDPSSTRCARSGQALAAQKRLARDHNFKSWAVLSRLNLSAIRFHRLF